jgi:hypothetical protein
LFYSKSDAFKWNPQYQPYGEDYVETFFDQTDPNGKRWKRGDLTGPGSRTGDSGKTWRGINVTAKGRHWQPASYVYEKYKRMTKDDLANYPLLTRLDKLDELGLIHWPEKAAGVPRYKCYLEDMPGVPLQDVWVDIKPLHNLSEERVGYPTQKPLSLLERIISSSSDEGDAILDPFCGCGTAIEAAEKLGRRWVGIDITYLAVPIIRKRLSAFPNAAYKLHGLPADLEGARVLAESDPYQFQWWVLDMIGASPSNSIVPMGREGKKGGDKGIDGVLRFRENQQDATSKRIIVSVKAGRNLNPAMVRELRGTMEREKAPIAVLLTMHQPSVQMRTEAANAGSYRPVGSKDSYQRLQIVTAADIFGKKKVEFPGYDVTSEEGVVSPQLSLFDSGVRRKPPRRVRSPEIVAEPVARALAADRGRRRQH